MNNKKQRAVLGWAIMRKKHQINHVTKELDDLRHHLKGLESLYENALISQGRDRATEDSDVLSMVNR